MASADDETLSSGGPRSVREPGESAAFFEAWAIYRKVIEFDYMGHNEVGATLESIIRGRHQTHSMLDLGCGDAELPWRYLQTLGIEEYHGVDLAAGPLTFAEERLSDMSTAVHLHRCDQAEFMATSARSFDVVVFGFALHHNPLDEKAALLAQARERLKRGGEILVYDVFRQPGESRDAYLARYLEWISRTWSELTPKEHEHLRNHILENDYPDSVLSVRECGLRARLSATDVHLRSCEGLHHLLRFR